MTAAPLLGGGAKLGAPCGVEPARKRGLRLAEVAGLYTARQRPLAGGKICIMADGYSKRELFRVRLPGGPMVVGAGWLTLHQLTGAPVLRVLTHLERRTQVVTIHPPLPVSEPDPATRLEVWREVVATLVADYVRRFPEQCPSLALPSSPMTGGRLAR